MKGETIDTKELFLLKQRGELTERRFFRKLDKLYTIFKGEGVKMNKYDLMKAQCIRAALFDLLCSADIKSKSNPIKDMFKELLMTLEEEEEKTFIKNVAKAFDQLEKDFEKD